MLDREQRGGVLMTIDVFPVRAVAERTATAVSTLLGRAIAHEIGHLLLGSAEHPRVGLMRALWSHEELRGLKPAHWGFSSREAAQHARNAAPAHPHGRLARLALHRFGAAGRIRAPQSHPSHPLHPLHPIGLYSRL